MNRYDRKSSLVWLGFSLLVIGGSLSYTPGTWSRPGPGFLPLLCGLVMAILSLGILVQATWGVKKGAAREGGPPFLTSRWPKIGAALSILLGYGLLLEPLGYLAVTFVFLLLALKVVEPNRWRTALIETVLATGFSYTLFEVLLKVQLPKGDWLKLLS